MKLIINSKKYNFTIIGDTIVLDGIGTAILDPELETVNVEFDNGEIYQDLGIHDIDSFSIGFWMIENYDEEFEADVLEACAN